MPRKRRIFISGQPQHVVVRGHNREPILTRKKDFEILYKSLRRASENNSLLVHAWVFMNNHIHLLVTSFSESSLPKTMQSVGRTYVQYFNKTYHRSGSLWEGRYKTTYVDTERYLFECYRYIELNPVRANLVDVPEEYPYSSYHANALGKVDKLVTEHEVFSAYLQGSESALTPTPEKIAELTPTPIQREKYRQFCQESIDRKTLLDIRRGTDKGIGIGTAEFLLKLAKMN